MPNPRYEIATGAADGLNRLFRAPTSYTEGTVAVFLNGLLLGGSWVEASPALGEVRLADPPPPGAVVQMFYIDTSGVAPETEVSRLSGRLKPLNGLKGYLAGSKAIAAAIRDQIALRRRKV